MFNFFPSLFLIFICLGVFVLTRRIFGEIAALFSVLFIVLLKSSAAILGPVFLVPLNIGLLFIPVGLWLIELSYGLYFVLFSSLLIIHPPSGLAFLLLASLSIFYKRKNIAKRLGLLVVGGLLALPLYINTFLSKGFETLDYLNFTIISNPLFIPRFLGYFATALVLIGIYFSLVNKKFELFTYSVVLLFFIILFYKLKIEFFLPYARALMYLFLIFAVAFGLGAWGLIESAKNKKAKYLIAFVLVFFILIFALPSKLESNGRFYHIIDEKDYNAFKWIKENTNISSIAVLDPWKANAFTPIAERQVYSRVVQGPSALYESKNKETEEFFADECKNITFLQQNNLSIVYGNCESEFLIEVYPGAYSINKVSRVIDGDTFELEDGEKVRLICVDTPEKGEKGYEEAKEFLANLTLGKIVRLEKDVSENDVYGRLLRYVYINENGKEVFVNRELVQKGYASVFRYGNDTKRCDDIEKDI